MKNEIKYVLGLDIGIGSVGWAVVRMDGTPRIETFGVKIFDSGESNNGKDRKSQDRRKFRSTRRLLRRRAHRRARLRFWFQKQGLATVQEINAFFAGREKDLISLRVRALEERLSPVELAACLIHISNHRGYREFYDVAEEDGEQDEDMQANAAGVQAVRKILTAGGYRSVAEMIAKDQAFAAEGSAYRRYRNRKGYKDRYIMPREEVEKEAHAILMAQQPYYPALTDAFVKKLEDILFSQRDFEDGPGDPADPRRPYKGFADTEGHCRFYTEEKRGHRFTYLADEYALVNVLSQYRYFDKETGEVTFSAELAQALLARAVRQGSLAIKDVNAISGKYGVKVITVKSDKKDSLPAATKYLKAVKPLLEEAGFDWEKLVEEDAADMQGCLLNRIGETLSANITPKRRRARLQQLPALAGRIELIEKLIRLHFSGTANVSNKYMAGAVAAFKEGDIYGNYQANFNKNSPAEQEVRRQYKLKPFGKEFEFYKNPVVFRSINEAHKAINRVIEEYGSPYAINIEVGRDLSKSYEARLEATREQAKNEKARQNAKKEIASLLSIREEEVTPVMCERYFLGEQQNWQCLYSGKPIDDKAKAIRNTGKEYEVDHIVPFSLVLDNTLHNKALVYHEENQQKGQRVPLEYLQGERAKEFKKRVNLLFRDKKISQKKYGYLMAASVFETGLLDSWKSRNLNDMRYISKFLVQYLKKTLQFRPADKQDDYRPEVYAVKGTITSQMRRLWLNSFTWGRQDKEELKKVTYLDHAADAIVLACCLPAYVEMTAVHQRLRQILKNNGGMPNREYDDVLAAAKKYIGRFYRIPEARLEYYLTQRSARPALVADLRTEADIRLQDPDICNFFEAEKAKREGRLPQTLSPEAVQDRFRREVLQFYKDDPAFAQSLQMPFTVHTVSRKASGQITDANAVRIAEQEGNAFKLTRKLAADLTETDLAKLYTHDEDLRASLAAVFAEDEKEKPTNKKGRMLGEILAERGITEFRTQKGTPVRRVTLRDTAKRTLRKQIGENNYSLLTDTSYYCVEVYKDEHGKTCTAGIAYSDIFIRGGKVLLKEGYRRPEGYKEHCLYLFSHDYIRVIKETKSGKEVKFEGYYRSVANINQSAFCYERYNTPAKQGKTFYISSRDTVEKFAIDPIGCVGGVVKCGEPLLSAKGSE